MEYCELESSSFLNDLPLPWSSDKGELANLSELSTIKVTLL